MNNRRGFTLVEVLLALGVFAFAAMGLVAGLNVVLSMAGEVQRSSTVRQQLEDRLAQLESGKLSPIKRTLELTSPNMKITEEVRREKVVRPQDRTELNGFWRVTVSAEWDEAGVPQQSEVSILRYMP